MTSRVTWSSRSRHRQNPTLEEPASDMPTSSSHVLAESSSTEIAMEPRGPEQPKHEHSAAYEDRWKMALLAMLYCVQGIPLGLAAGTMPALLQPLISLSSMATFTLATYPYSLKLLWSPIVDSFYSRSLGRRKTWIVPCQLILACIFYYLSIIIQPMLESGEVDVASLTVLVFALIFFAATQDIAVDGLALEILQKKNLVYASTCQSVGLNIGFFSSFTIFLTLNSKDFCNAYIFSEEQERGLLDLPTFFWYVAILFIIVTAILVAFNQEAAIHKSDELSITESYTQMWSIITLPSVLKLIAVLLIGKVGFVAYDVLTPLKLLELGLPREKLGIVAIIDFPFQILFGILVARWCNGPRPLKPYLVASFFRFVTISFGLIVIANFPSGELTNTYFFIIVGSGLATMIFNNMMFVALSAFFVRISDPLVGGTYLTLLNTCTNFGGVWPKYFAIRAVDVFSRAHCQLPDAVIDLSLTCVDAAGKKLCAEQNGTCIVERDGFYIVTIGSLLLGAVVVLGFVIKKTRELEAYPESAWRDYGKKRSTL